MFCIINSSSKIIFLKKYIKINDFRKIKKHLKTRREREREKK